MKRHALDDLDADIRDHIERETADNIERGMTPDDARAAALRAFGSVALTKENVRAVWIPVWFDQLIQDARYGLRMIRRAPAFSAVVMLTLALGIGLTTAVFGVVNAVLVRPLLYPNAERLVWIATSEEGSNEELVLSPDLIAWRDQAQSLDRIAGFSIGGERIDVGDEVVQARVAAATDGFWDIAGARPALGTVPRSGEEASCCRTRSSSAGSAAIRESLAGRFRSTGGPPPSPACCRADSACSYRRRRHGAVCSPARSTSIGNRSCRRRGHRARRPPYSCSK